MAEKRPNIVVIMVDEMRGDCLGSAGHPDIQTPYIDSLAAMGIRYTNAYSACPTCVPARAEFHTGLSQVHTGRVGYRDGVDWNYPHTLAGELTRAGYQTQCVGKMHVHPLRNRLGFENVVLHDGYLHYYRKPTTPAYEYQPLADDYYAFLKSELGAAADGYDSGIDCNGWTARPWPYEERLHPTNWVAERSIDFLRSRDRSAPFFLFTSFVRPHAPYDAPEAFFQLYRQRDLRPPLTGDWDDMSFVEREGRVFNNIFGPSDPELIRQQMIGYYACISHVDNQIGRLLIALTEQQLMEDTVIVFVSDHGEMLSDHGFDRKSLPYRGSALIPLILSGPEKYLGARKAGGRTDARLAELRDVMPTLLKLAGVSDLPPMDGLDLLGREIRDALHGEHTYNPPFSNQFIVTERDKYIWFSQDGREQYFDLAKDPLETHNAIADPEYAARIEELRGRLIRELTGRPEGYVEDGRLVAGKRPRAVLDSEE